jgi:hypothetical protein
LFFKTAAFSSPNQNSFVKIALKNISLREKKLGTSKKKSGSDINRMGNQAGYWDMKVRGGPIISRRN